MNFEKPTMTRYQAIRTLEAAAQIEPRTTIESYRETTPAERDEYITWLRRQCPATSPFIPSNLIH